MQKSKLNLQQEDNDALLFEVEKVEGAETMAHALCANGSQDVKFIHQVFGLFRVEEPMSELFRLSSSAWRAYATRNGCEYKLWTADEVDTLIQLEAPEWLQILYRDVRFPVQRVDVARFFILWKYGGLYADLDVFPNIDTFPLVPLGMCKMLARETKTMRQKHEWEMEVVVATNGNQLLLDILDAMSDAMAEKSQMPWYYDKPCRFIYHTTGPKQVSRFMSSFIKGCEPQVTVFSMCRPVQDLDKHITVADTGHVCCHMSGMESYDVLSAFSMSYNTAGPNHVPPLAMPIAQLPPYPMKRRRYRHTTKKKGNGCEPQENSFDEDLVEWWDKQERKDAFDDMAQLFMTERDLVEEVSYVYGMLSEDTRTYLRSLEEQRE